MSQKRKLFIIGNGFDLAHGLKTKYKDFRDWLVEEYVEDEYKCTLPEFTVGNHGEDVCTSLSELASFIIYMVDNACCSADDNPGDMWSDLESATSRFEFSDFLEYKAENKYDKYHINSDNVCHIHGRQGEEIFFGHKKEDNRTEEYLEKYVGSESNLQR